VLVMLTSLKTERAARSDTATCRPTRSIYYDALQESLAT
jgi:hypothetical protein